MPDKPISDEKKSNPKEFLANPQEDTPGTQITAEQGEIKPIGKELNPNAENKPIFPLWQKVCAWWAGRPKREPVRSTDKVIMWATVVIAIAAGLQWYEMHTGGQDTHLLAESAKKQADQLVLGERPWIKIEHRIVSPLTFNVGGRASGIPVAMMTVEDTIENVGQTVAVNVFSWEDVIPADLDHSIKTARARQKEYCDANRHPDPRGLSGYTLFPHDPFIGQSIVGPQMPKVEAATIQNEFGLIGKSAFVLVGCVTYRSSAEPQSAPTHQTRFIYWLGVPQNTGGFQPYVIPNGAATELRLIAMPDGFSAD